jgi:hypothetical protein
LSSGVVVVVLELCFAVVALKLLHQALDSVFFLQNPGSVRSVHQQMACKPWLFVYLRLLRRGVKLLLPLDANKTDALHELDLLAPALASKKQQK